MFTFFYFLVCGIVHTILQGLEARSGYGMRVRAALGAVEGRLPGIGLGGEGEAVENRPLTTLKFSRIT